MSGPPGSQVVPKKSKRKNNNNKKLDNSTDAQPQKSDGAAQTEHIKSVVSAPSSAPGPTSSFQMPRQEHVYVEPCPLAELYDQLPHGASSSNNSANHGNNGAAVSSSGRNRKQASNKRRAFALQRDFSDLPYPRGMVNNSNFCFMNSILQALIFIPAFAQLAVSCSCDPQARECCPTLSTLGKWILQYWKPGYTRLSVVAPPLMPRAKPGAGGGSAAPSPPPSQRALDGSVQEDAQEFLQKLLERIQEELVAFEDTSRRDSEAVSTARSDRTTATEDNANNTTVSSNAASQKGWTVVKGKEKLAVREHVDVQGQSRLLGAIFGGTLESHLQGKQRQRDHVSVVVEKYFCVPVDIGFASECTMEQALEHTFTSERIYDSEREKNLKKTLRFGQLPSILLVQLRRWAMTREGNLVKLGNVVHLKRLLQIPRTICGDETLSNAERTYRLLSVVCHRGDAVGRGHYVTYLAQHAASPEMAKVQTTGKGNEAEAVRSAPPSSSVILCNDTNVSVAAAMNMEKETTYFLVYQKMN